MRCAERGMTLLEAVVALAIVGVSAVAALGTVGAELRAAGQARDAIIAAALAEERLSRIALLRPDEFASLSDSIRSGTFPPPLSEFQWETVTRTVPQQDGIYGATVVITWSHRGRYAVDTRLYRPVSRRLP